MAKHYAEEEACYFVVLPRQNGFRPGRFELEHRYKMNTRGPEEFIKLPPRVVGLEVSLRLCSSTSEQLCCDDDDQEHGDGDDDDDVRKQLTRVPGMSGGYRTRNISTQSTHTKWRVPVLQPTKVQIINHA